MKTFYISIADAFKKGLRTRADDVAEGAALTSCTNVKPSPVGLIHVDKYVRAFNLNEDAYIFNCYAGVFVLTMTTLYTYDPITQVLTAQVTDIAGQLPWTCADFKAYIIFTNGTVNVIREADGTFIKDAGVKLPVAGTICTHRGRAILGNLKYDRTKDIDWGQANWVAWSEIGYLEFLSVSNIATARKNTSGFMPMPWKGTVWKVLPLGKAVIVYGDGGISALFLASAEKVFTYGLQDISTVGLLDEAAVAADGAEDSTTRHYFVRADGMVCMLDLELKITELGYKEFFPAVAATAYTYYKANGTYLANGSIYARGFTKNTAPQTRVFFDSSRKEVFITSGSKTYILTQYGLGATDASLRDGFYSKAQGLILHSVAAIAQGAIEFTSDLLTLNAVGLKSIEFALVNVSSPNAIEIAVESRKSLAAAFTSSPWKTLNSEGMARISSLGLQFRIKLRIQAYTEMTLSSMKLAVQFRDKRYTRGVINQPKGGVEL